FTKILSATFLNNKKIPYPKDWLSALELLRLQIEAFPSHQKVIIFLDELPWMASQKSNFLPMLDNLWNRYLSRMPNVILAVCGSAASWMIDNIVSNTGGLYGRLTRKIHLQPFTLAETKQFLLSKKIDLDHKQIIELYMAMGGVPKYLSQIDPGRSSTQIINELFFTPHGYLFDEFNKLYSSLFNNYEKHIKIVKILAKTQSGLTREELLKKLGLESGGSLSKILGELEESGFIMRVDRYASTKSLKSLSQFRLIDQYSLFYLKWVESSGKILNSLGLDNYWIQQVNTNAWKIWGGYAFENICLMHLGQIQKALGLAGIRLSAHTWYYRGDNAESGAQIDLVLDRADHCINLCEIKYYNQVFEVTKKYGLALNAKKEIFREKTNSKKSLLTTLITTYGVLDNIHAQEYLQSAITMDALFD
ncbi:MAG: ATP-binding protein, partial [Gammaproteobacteria bacterium]